MALVLLVQLVPLVPAWGAPSNVAAGGDECTLAAAAGYCAKGGGTIVLKNRDRNTRFMQSFSFEKPEEGYAFAGIKNIEENARDRYAYTMGINEAGLVCVSSSAPKKIDFDFGKRPFRVLHPGHILRSVATVDEFVEKYIHGRGFKGSMNYIVADEKKICLVEVVDRDHFDYRVIYNGSVCQTNHYHMNGMKRYQPEPLPKSSAARLARAIALTGSGARTLGAGDLMRISCDHGPAGDASDLTICRHPEMRYDAAKFDGGTISAMAFESRPGERPAAYVCMGQPCTGKWYRFTIEGRGLVFNRIAEPFMADGSWNAAADIWRDAAFHLIRPFFTDAPAPAAAGGSDGASGKKACTKREIKKSGASNDATEEEI